MPAPRPQRADRLVCKCLAVGQREVQAAIAAGARTVAGVGERCEAGTGCSSCHPAVIGLLEAAAVRRARAVARKAAGHPQLGLFAGDGPTSGDAADPGDAG